MRKTKRSEGKDKKGEPNNSLGGGNGKIVMVGNGKENE
jgi:hypothetical protein